jgi:predicted amidophosphoribosyltransferase
MEYFLICTNTKCRFIVNLREGAQVLERSKLVIDECPECGHPWSSCCPFCGRPLEAIRRGNLSHCLHCGRELRPDANADPTVP